MPQLADPCRSGVLVPIAVLAVIAGIAIAVLAVISIAGIDRHASSDFDTRLALGPAG